LYINHASETYIYIYIYSPTSVSGHVDEKDQLSAVSGEVHSVIIVQVLQAEVVNGVVCTRGLVTVHALSQHRAKRPKQPRHKKPPWRTPPRSHDGDVWRVQ
jgi:hypothetical protein